MAAVIDRLLIPHNIKIPFVGRTRVWGFFLYIILISFRCISSWKSHANENITLQINYDFVNRFCWKNFCQFVWHHGFSYLIVTDDKRINSLASFYILCETPWLAARNGMLAFVVVEKFQWKIRNFSFDKIMPSKLLPFVSVYFVIDCFLDWAHTHTHTPSLCHFIASVFDVVALPASFSLLISNARMVFFFGVLTYTPNGFVLLLLFSVFLSLFLLFSFWWF